MPYTFHPCNRIKIPIPETTGSAEHPHPALSHCSSLSHSSRGQTLFCSSSAILNKLYLISTGLFYSVYSQVRSFAGFKVVFLPSRAPSRLNLPGHTQARVQKPCGGWDTGQRSSLSPLLTAVKNGGRKAIKGTAYLLHIQKCFPSWKRCQYTKKPIGKTKGCWPQKKSNRYSPHSLLQMWDHFHFSSTRVGFLIHFTCKNPSESRT